MIALWLALAVQTAPSQAAASTAAAPPASGTKTVEDKVECRSEIVTGSHFPTRTCMHHSDWVRLHEQSVEELGRRGTDRQAGMHPN